MRSIFIFLLFLILFSVSVSTGLDGPNNVSFEPILSTSRRSDDASIAVGLIVGLGAIFGLPLLICLVVFGGILIVIVAFILLLGVVCFVFIIVFLVLLVLIVLICGAVLVLFCVCGVVDFDAGYEGVPDGTFGHEQEGESEYTKFDKVDFMDVESPVAVPADEHSINLN